MKTIVITGGAGYIGSHTAWLLVQQGYKVVIVDSMEHNQTWLHEWAVCIKADIADEAVLDTIFTSYQVHAVVHCAAYIEVGRSVTDPLAFYDNNVAKTISLLRSMHKHNVHTIIFSSSCAVYGVPQQVPLTEDHPKNPISPYGATKLMVEQIFVDCARAYGLRYVALRYFNAAGALASEGLGEFHEPETHVIPLLVRAALAHTPFTVFGTDHATPDGTCVRDYVHVLDIADAHVKALEYLDAGNKSDMFNLGTGTGVSVQELITVVQEVTNKTVRVVYAGRRAGDPAVLVADASKAQLALRWIPSFSRMHTIITSALEMCLSTSMAPRDMRKCGSICPD